MESIAERLPLVEEYRPDLAGCGDIVPIHGWQEVELARRKEASSLTPAGARGSCVNMTPEVQQDLAKAYQWYEGQRPGRGEEFLDYVRAGLQAIARNPSLNLLSHGTYRRCLMRPFPFAAFYEISDGKVVVYGVLPTSADPEKWHPPLAAPANRMHQAVLIVATILGSWLGMQIVHEFGHVLGGWMTGGRPSRVVLHPLTISRTDWSQNPHPLVVAWAGPILGVILPLTILVLLRRKRGAYLIRFFAGFCCIANGAYIAGGSFDRLGDAGDILRNGPPIWQLWLFGLATIPLGLWLWHRQGPHFGLRLARGKVSVRAAYGTLIVLIMITIIEFLFSFID